MIRVGTLKKLIEDLDDDASITIEVTTQDDQFASAFLKEIVVDNDELVLVGYEEGVA